GVSQRAAIAAALMDGGLAGETPVAAIAQATTTEQVVGRCRLVDLALLDVESPATLVIGAVAALDVTAPVAAVATTA
ncbi:MAG TPA: uroporphyrinogen-III C-methyltransferase, partial [Ilumatobacteraceae bacterium]|nr:uroporphyrinogen-III C-methyltransferase [Ilumatobacteraceae bacterium]